MEKNNKIILPACERGLVMKDTGFARIFKSLILINLLVLLQACGSGSGPDSVQETVELQSDSLTLIWSDEFNEGTSPSIENWTVETGYGDNGWGNDEWQNYQNSSENLYIDDGHLVIHARCDTAPTCGKRDGSITSARINTKNKFSFKYGRVQARIDMPSGLGTWPAFWMLGADFPDLSWPDAGEIDIVEMHYFYSDKFTTHFTTHWAGPRYTDENRPSCSGRVDAIDSDEEQNCKSETLTFDDALTDGFHVYELEWNETSITGKIDGIVYFTQAIDPDTMEEFLKRYFLILNIAVGGTLGGPSGPDASMDWSDLDQTTMRVDWVRVYGQETPDTATLGSGEGSDLGFDRVINTAEFGGGFVDTDLNSTAVEPFVGDTVVESNFFTTASPNGGTDRDYAGAIFAMNRADLSSYDVFSFALNTSDFPDFFDLGVEFQDSRYDPNNGVTDGAVQVRTSDYIVGSTLGGLSFGALNEETSSSESPWVEIEIPLSEFAGVNLDDVTAIGFFNPEDENGQLIGGTAYFDAITFDKELCTTPGTVALGTSVYNPLSTVGSVTVSDPCAPSSQVQVQLTSGDEEIFLAVDLDAAGEGEALFGIVNSLSVCPTSDSDSVLGVAGSITATYTTNYESSEGEALSEEVMSVATINGSAPIGTVTGDDLYFYATDSNQTLAFLPDSSFEYSVFDSGTTLNGAFSDSTFDPVFAVTSGTGYGAQVAQVVLFNIAEGFAEGKDSINFKIKDVPGNTIKVEMGKAGTSTSNTETIALTSFSGSSSLGDGWYEVSIPVSEYPDTSDYDYIAFTSDTPSESQYTFLITDIYLTESLEIVGAECAELVGPDTPIDTESSVTPDLILYTSDPDGAPADLAEGAGYTSLEAFGSGSTFDIAYAQDASFNPAFSVTTGTGYGANIGQLAFLGFEAGWASEYGTLDFKAKGLSNDVIRVRFLDGGDYRDITLSSDEVSASINNGWYQVSIPLASMTGVDTGTGLLFETDNLSDSEFTFLLADIGFSGTPEVDEDPGDSGSGGSGLDYVYATDPSETIDLVSGVDYGAVQEFGSGSAFNANFTEDADYNPAYAVTSGTGYGVELGLLAFPGFNAGFASGYESLNFKVKGTVNDIIKIKFASGGGPELELSYNLTSYEGSTSLGNGWYQMVVPMTDFPDLDVYTEFLFVSDVSSTGQFTFLLTDIAFAFPGASETQDLVYVYATDSSEIIDLVAGVDYSSVQEFGSGSAFDSSFSADADYNPAYAVTSGTGYGVELGLLAFTGFSAGFASGYESLNFKVKDVVNDVIKVKFASGGGAELELTYNVTTYEGATSLGNGWYQMVIPMSDFPDQDVYTEFLFVSDVSSSGQFTFLLTDIGFAEPEAAPLADLVYIYATDSAETIDLVAGVDYSSVQEFGSGSAFDSSFSADADYNPAYAVTSGTGYGVELGLLAFTGFSAGFASGYESLNFKVKDVVNDVIKVKFASGGGAELELTYNVMTYEGATSLGNGWYQMVIPLTDFPDQDVYTEFLFVSDVSSSGQFTYLLTDIGFAEPEAAPVADLVYIYATDSAETIDLVAGVDYSSVQEFGSGSAFEANTTGDGDYDPAYGVTSGTGYGVELGLLAFTGFTAGFASGYESLNFKVKGVVNDVIKVKFASGGGAELELTYNVTSYSGATDLGNGWYQMVIPMSDFPDQDVYTEFLFVSDVSSTGQFTYLLTDIGFAEASSGSGGGSGTEIATNGGFEEGDFTGWTQFESQTGNQTVNANSGSDPSSEGSFHLQINNTASGTNSLIKLERIGDGTVAPGSSWTLTFDARGSLDDGGVAFAQVFSETASGIEDCTGCGILGGAPLTLNADSTVWTSFEFEGVAGSSAESLTVQLEAVTGGGAFANVYYDNISVVVSAP